MSKIDDYTTAVKVYRNLADAVQAALGRDSKSNDKHFARLDCTGSDTVLHFHASYGYYGSSSCYSAKSPAMVKYFAMAVNERMAALLDRAVELAAKDAETARQAAESEARHILKLTQGGGAA